MGWGRFIMLGKVGHEIDLQDQKAAIEYLRQRRDFEEKRSFSTLKQVQHLQREVDDLKLYLTATLKLLQAKGVATPAEIEGTVGAIDRHDDDDAHAPKQEPRR